MLHNSYFSILKSAFSSWKNDNASVWSAALSYYTVFSLAPLLLIVISICGILFGKAAIEGHVYGQISGLLGKDGATLVQTMIANTSKPKTNIITSIIGIITLLLGAAGVFGQLQQALNTIWGVKQKPHVGIWGLLRERLLTFSMIFVIGFLLAVSLIASAIVAGVSSLLVHFFPGAPIIITIINEIISLLVIGVLFALLFKFLPDIKIPWKPVFVGATFTSVLFTIGKTLIGWYIGRSSYATTYGAAASLAILLVWVYYASQILFFGAEVTKAYVKQNQIKVAPNALAKPKSSFPKTKKKDTGKNLAVLFGYFVAGVFLRKRKNK